MIPGLKIPQEVERQVWSAFDGWADHFRQSLTTRGIGGLLLQYEELVESVETQSCLHGPGHQRQTGSSWQACCGISYEYLNDIAVRDALDVILKLCPGDATQSLRGKVASLDGRLYQLYTHQPPRVVNWWREGLPRGIVP